MILNTLESNKKYGIIYTDPPWQQTKGNLRKCRPNQGKTLDYQTMDLQSIMEHQKQAYTMADDKCNIFMWTIDKFIRDVEEEMTRGGYCLHARLVWDKTNGIAPAFTVRFSHEYLLWFYKKGHILMPRQETRGKYTTVFREQATKHSKKPQCVYEMLEDMFPKVNKLEMYARTPREGWDSFGNELEIRE